MTPRWRAAGRWIGPLGRVAGVLLLLLTARCAEPPEPAERSGPDWVRLPPIPEPEARMPARSIPAMLKLPPGQGPFPAVIVLHGCGGLGASQTEWAARLNTWGYAALIPDSLTPRGVRRVCEPAAQGFVTARDRAGDVGAAAAWLRTQREIDPERIAVLGLSHGGAAAVTATERIYAGFHLSAAIDYYGPCVNPAAHGTVPLLVLAGGDDDWGHPAARCQGFGAALGPDQPFEQHTYPGVYHAFDNPLMTRTISNDHIMQYDPAAAADSFLRVHAFLDHWVGHAAPARPR